MKKIFILIYLILQLMGCASRAPNELIQKKINLLNETEFLNDLFKDKDVEVILKYENSVKVKGEFEKAASEYIILQTIYEVKYIPLTQIESIIIKEKQPSLGWVIMVMGSAGALIGGLNTISSNEKNQSDLGESVSSIKDPILGAMLGSAIGALAGFIIDRFVTQIQSIKYLLNSSPAQGFLKTRAFDAEQLMEVWDLRGVKFPVKKTKIKKLLNFSELVILENSTGVEIDARENNKYRLFSGTTNLYKAYLFKLTLPNKRSCKYFTIIITTSNNAKFKMLKAKDIFNMKSKIK